MIRTVQYIFLSFNDYLDRLEPFVPWREELIVIRWQTRLIWKRVATSVYLSFICEAEAIHVIYRDPCVRYVRYINHSV